MHIMILEPRLYYISYTSRVHISAVSAFREGRIAANKLQAMFSLSSRTKLNSTQLLYAIIMSLIMILIAEHTTPCF